MLPIFCLMVVLVISEKRCLDWWHTLQTHRHPTMVLEISQCLYIVITLHYFSLSHCLCTDNWPVYFVLGGITCTQKPKEMWMEPVPFAWFEKKKCTVVYSVLSSLASCIAFLYLERWSYCSVPQIRFSSSHQFCVIIFLLSSLLYMLCVCWYFFSLCSLSSSSSTLLFLRVRLWVLPPPPPPHRSIIESPTGVNSVMPDYNVTSGCPLICKCINHTLPLWLFGGSELLGVGSSPVSSALSDCLSAYSFLPAYLLACLCSLAWLYYLPARLPSLSACLPSYRLSPCALLSACLHAWLPDCLIQSSRQC